MKKVIFVLTLCFCALLCGCGMSEGTIVGVWSGSGSVSVLGLGAEDKSVPVETWTFREDGTAKLVVSLGETELPETEFSYNFEEGVLSLSSGSRTVEVPCQQAGDTLVFDPAAENPAIFTRAG